MSASDTNLKKQRRHHRPALIGTAIAVIFALGIFAIYSIQATDGERPETAAEPVAPVTEPAD